MREAVLGRAVVLSALVLGLSIPPAGNGGPVPLLHEAGLAVAVDPQPDPVVVAAGDIALCTSPGDEATAALVAGIPEATVITTGDNAYPAGAPTDFANCYDPSWGAHKHRTYPSPGNHEYMTSGAGGYFGYFGAAAGEPGKGYYSYDLGAWHIIALNSNCTAVGGCGSASPQGQWLQADLAAHVRGCTLAYWHHPRFSSGKHGNSSAVKPLWQALYAAGADVVLNGHDHLYEAFDPQNPDGVADVRGIRQFTVGTGGADAYTLLATQPNSRSRNTGTFGVLKLTLHPTAYDWQFIPVPGGTFADIGAADCVVGSGNLLANPGFEADSNADTRPDRWTSNVRFSRSTGATPHGGSYLGQHTAADPATTSYTVSQVVPGLTAGAVYDFSAWVGIPATTDTFTFGLEIVWRSSSNAVLSRTPVRTWIGPNQGQWEQAQASVTAPVGTTNAQVRMVVKGLSATVHVDDFSLWRR